MYIKTPIKILFIIMKFHSLKQILALLYITSILCDYQMTYGQDYLDYIDDVMTCTGANDEEEDDLPTTTSLCKSRNSSLKAGGEYKGECCYISYTMDMLHNYKLLYPDSWEEKLKELGNERYLDIEICNILLSKSILRNNVLYTFSLFTKNNNVNYNCGDETKTFSSLSYNPTDQDEISLKELTDCSLNYNENDCTAKSKTFKSSGQCCWFTAIYDDGTEETEEIKNSACSGIQGFSKENFKDVQTAMSKVGANSFKYSFICGDKNGKKVSGTYDAVNQNVNVDSNQYYLGVSILLVIGLLGIMF